MPQPVNEYALVDGGIARAGGGHVDQPRNAFGQRGQGVRACDVALQPLDATVVGGRVAAQRVHLVATRQEAPRHALAEVAAADEKYAFSHDAALVREKGAPEGALRQGIQQP
ncbi:hypothetical protein D3C72_762280 [compost metagenome]